MNNLSKVMADSGVDLRNNFMDTSPSTGYYTASTLSDWINPADVNAGDVHYYYLEDDCEAQETHPLAHFVSESGFQSEPSFIDYVDVSVPYDWR